MVGYENSNGGMVMPVSPMGGGYGSGYGDGGWWSWIRDAMDAVSRLR